MNHAALSLGKFYARRIERRNIHTLAIKYRYLRYGKTHRTVLTRIKEVLHAT
jgi:hypothetical protein